MVKIGFIGEGKTEQLVLQSELFQGWLWQNGIDCVGKIIDAKGSGNLLPNRIELLRNELLEYGAEKIVILTDLDNDKSVDITKQRIGENHNQVVLVAVQKIEAWFLADTQVLCQLTNSSVYVEQPEQSQEPFALIQQIFQEKTGRGVGTKHILVRKMLKYGFTIQQAAQHPNCPSAQYFLIKLKTLASAKQS